MYQGHETSFNLASFFFALAAYLYCHFHSRAFRARSLIAIVGSWFIFLIKAIIAWREDYQIPIPEWKKENLYSTSWTLPFGKVILRCNIWFEGNYEKSPCLTLHAIRMKKKIVLMGVFFPLNFVCFFIYIHICNVYRALFFVKMLIRFAFTPRCCTLLRYLLHTGCLHESK